MMLVDNKCYCHGGQKDCPYSKEEERLPTRQYFRRSRSMVTTAPRCALEEALKQSPAVITSIQLRPYTPPRKDIPDGVCRRPKEDEKRRT
jgi:hypothetical protein